MERSQRLRSKKANRRLCFPSLLQEQKHNTDMLQATFPHNNTKALGILNTTSPSLARTLFRKTRTKLDITDKELFQLHICFSNKIYPAIWNRIDMLAEFRAENFTYGKATSHRKFNIRSSINNTNIGEQPVR
ncbi:hypothetical protein Trydic_g15979 [Trypoxylus dichotomus]